MKKAEDILDDGLKSLKPGGFVVLFYQVNRLKVIKLLEGIQKDAYNQALEDASKSATTCEDWEDYTGNTGSEYPASIIVDKESILKLKKT